MFKNFYYPSIDEKDPHMCLTQDITIYDCLEIYSQEKKLTGEKNFICSKCSRNVTPVQTIYPYSSPKYLILGIQRIKKKFEDLTEMINNKKDDRLVGYPLEDFDVTSYFINDTLLNKDNPSKKSIYNLKSIILHCGTIKKSNYKSIVKNNNLWYEINDNEIKQINVNRVIDQNAYILIYEKIDKFDENENKNGIKKKEKEDKKNDKNIILKNEKDYIELAKRNAKKIKEAKPLPIFTLAYLQNVIELLGPSLEVNQINEILKISNNIFNKKLNEGGKKKVSSKPNYKVGKFNENDNGEYDDEDEFEEGEEEEEEQNQDIDKFIV